MLIYCQFFFFKNSHLSHTSFVLDQAWIDKIWRIKIISGGNRYKFRVNCHLFGNVLGGNLILLWVHFHIRLAFEYFVKTTKNFLPPPFFGNANLPGQTMIKCNKEYILAWWAVWQGRWLKSDMTKSHSEEAKNCVSCKFCAIWNVSRADCVVGQPLARQGSRGRRSNSQNSLSTLLCKSLHNKGSFT